MSEQDALRGLQLTVSLLSDEIREMREEIAKLRRARRPLVFALVSWVGSLRGRLG